MIARPLDRAGVCVCGLGVAAHFDMADRRMTCDDARERFLRAFQPATRRAPATVLPFPCVAPSQPAGEILRVVCSWCRCVIAEGTPGAPTSHGCCPTCSEREFLSAPLERHT